ncbi:MAG: FAD-binding oxidoreductase, partial [Solirubrobacteraceae bacterium]
MPSVSEPGSIAEAAGELASGQHVSIDREGGDVVVSTRRLNRVLEHEPGDLTAIVEAGIRLSELQAQLAPHGQMLALDPPGDPTIGACLAGDLSGPRRHRYGAMRDLVIGVTVVLAGGTVASSGGKVVKNVAGYDLGKLFAGSAGTLGLITEATFRLHPLPAARAYVTAEYVAVPVACDAVAAAANSPLVSSAVELTRAAPDGPIRIGVLLEGTADGVAARSMRMADLLGKAEVAAEPPAWWGGGPSAGAGETLIRVSFWVSALG